MFARFALTLLCALPLLAACTTPPRDASPLDKAVGSHVMIATNDYAGTLKWYQKMLGFRVAHEWRVPQLRNAQLAYLEKNGFMVEVIGSHLLPKNPKNGTTPRPGYGHFGLWVDDVDAAFHQLELKKVTVIERPRPSVTGLYRVAFIADNNGNVIELANGPRAD